MLLAVTGALNSTVKRHLADIVAKLQEVQASAEATVILVGSAAREKQTWRSDTDFLVITPMGLPRWRVPVDLHIHFETRETFLKKLNRGNDFEAWAVRFGKVCTDASGWWPQALADKESQVWPDWQLKVHHARKRQSIASRMLEDGDWDAAEEEYLMFATHIARAFLLRAHVFPLSRPEMPAQLVEIGLPSDAHLLDQLISGTKDVEELQQIATFFEQRLDELEQLTKTPGAQRKLTTKRLSK